MAGRLGQTGNQGQAGERGSQGGSGPQGSRGRDGERVSCHIIKSEWRHFSTFLIKGIFM